MSIVVKKPLSFSINYICLVKQQQSKLSHRKIAEQNSLFIRESLSDFAVIDQIGVKHNYNVL